MSTSISAFPDSSRFDLLLQFANARKMTRLQRSVSVTITGTQNAQK